MNGEAGMENSQKARKRRTREDDGRGQGRRNDGKIVTEELRRLTRTDAWRGSVPTVAAASRVPVPVYMSDSHVQRGGGERHCSR